MMSCFQRRQSKEMDSENFATSSAGPAAKRPLRETGDFFFINARMLVRVGIGRHFEIFVCSPRNHEDIQGGPAKIARVCMSAILDVEKLRKSYRSGEGELTVLKEVSFQLNERDSLAIVGPSGSGKTTLLGLCAGLDLPSSGRVSVAGKNLGALDEDGRAALRNEVVGFVFQNFQLLPTLTALENVMVPMELRGGKGVRERAMNLLAEVGLAERSTHYPAQLSGGEQQRIALARAFINEPRLLFADEPTGNLDSENSHHIVDLLFGLNKAAGTALVLVTHNPELAQLTRRIIRLKSGAVIEDTGARA